MRRYRKYEDVLNELRAKIESFSQRGTSSLPSERELSKELGASRMTVRKALAQVEGDGLIRRSEKVRTEILARRNPLVGCGRILFLASGRYSNFGLPAMERLWTKLVPEVTRQGGDLELFLVNPDTSSAVWAERIGAARCILATTWGSSAPINHLLGESALRVPVFSLTDSLPAPNSICLDNLKVGYLAAEALLGAGCRRPVAIAPDYRASKGVAFKKRLTGFATCLRESGLVRPDMVKLVSYPHPGRFRSQIGDRYIHESRGLLETAYQEGCDGAFMICDVDIGSIAMNLFREGAIPEKFRLITVNGSGDSMRNYPLVSCINHATADIVEAVVAQLRCIADGCFVAPVNIAVAPGIYVNQTLGHGTKISDHHTP